MRRTHIVGIFLLSFLLLLVNFAFASQERQQRQKRRRAPWSERSPAIGKKVPDVKIYDENLNEISLKDLYKDTILVFQWGGCT